LHDYLIPLDRLRDFDAPEAQALYAWCREFEKRCTAMRAVDDARLSHWMYDIEFSPDNPLAFAGFDALPPAVARLVDRWRSQGHVEDPDIQPAPANDVLVIAAADARSELELAAQWARTQVEQGSGSIGVIVADLQSRNDEVRRVFEDVFAPGLRHAHASTASIPVVVAAPSPLIDYPIVDAAILVLNLAIGESNSTIAGRILRSPFIVGGEAERSRRALADLRLRDEQRDRWNWLELERWAAVMQCEQLQLAARDMNALLRGTTGTLTASEWAERFHAQLRTVGWPGDRTLTSIEHQTVAKFQDALAEFGALDAVTHRMNAQKALSRLRDLLRDTPFEPEAAHGSVIVIDATTSAGMQFDALWIVGLQSDRLPSPVNPDVLIPLELQREFSLPEATAGGTLQLATMQFERWLRSSPSIRFSWPEREGDAELSMSPLLSCYPHEKVKSGSHITTLRSAIFERRPVLATIQDDRAPRFRGEAGRGGAAIVELQSRCAFKAQAQLRLKAEQMSRVSLGVDPPDRGSILHKVLEEIWGQLGTQDALLHLPDPMLEARVRDAAQRFTATALRPDTRVRERLAALEVSSCVRQVLQLLAIEKQRPPFTVRFAEAAERFEIGGLKITLRPDRIDELGEGGEVLIDYKLGASNRPSEWLDALPGRPRQPQLPLYGLAHGERLRALAFVILAPGKVEYRGLSDGAQVGLGVDRYPGRMRIDLGDPVDWVSLQHHWQFTLTRLAERFVAGEAAVDPLPSECERCHLSTLCRIYELAAGELTEVGDE
jgi:probable DNA repair protein